MKSGIHPDNYRPVVFQDLSDGTNFVTRSTAKTNEKITIDGTEYPLVKVHISSASHPFYTGQEKLLDVEGRVDKFKARTEAAKKKREEAKKRASNPAKKAEKLEDKAEKTQKLG